MILRAIAGALDELGKTSIGWGRSRWPCCAIWPRSPHWYPWSKITPDASERPHPVSPEEAHPRRDHGRKPLPNARP